MKPSRTVLSVPGHINKMHSKAVKSDADVVMFDLEDSVPAIEKEAARKTVINSLGRINSEEKIVSVRINGLDTPYAYRDIIEVVEAAGERIKTVVIPKADSPGDVHCVSRLLDGLEMAGGFSRKIGIEASIETARGLDAVSKIARASSRLKSLVFGIADYAASIGARLVSLSGHGENEADLYPGHRWHYPLSRLVMAAKANDLMAIDAPFGNFKDTEGLRHSAEMASALGCDGKWVIHPHQIDSVNQVFTPSKSDIQRAGKVLKAAESAAIRGKGAVAVKGKMIDRATVRLARQVWDQAVYLKLI